MTLWNPSICASVFRIWAFSVWRRETWRNQFPYESRRRSTLLTVSRAYLVGWKFSFQGCYCFGWFVHFCPAFASVVEQWVALFSFFSPIFIFFWETLFPFCVPPSLSSLASHYESLWIAAFFCPSHPADRVLSAGEVLMLLLAWFYSMGAGTGSKEIHSSTDFSQVRGELCCYRTTPVGTYPQAVVLYDSWSDLAVGCSQKASSCPSLHPWSHTPTTSLASNREAVWLHGEETQQDAPMENQLAKKKHNSFPLDQLAKPMYLTATWLVNQCTEFCSCSLSSCRERFLWRLNSLHRSAVFRIVLCKVDWN